MARCAEAATEKSYAKVAALVTVGELSRRTHKEIVAQKLLLLIPLYPLEYLHRLAKLEKSARSRKKLMREYTWLCCEIRAWRVDGRLDDTGCDMFYLKRMEGRSSPGEQMPESFETTITGSDRRIKGVALKRKCRLQEV